MGRLGIWGRIAIVWLPPPFILFGAGAANHLCRTCLASGAIVLPARFNMYRYVRTYHLFADSLFNIIRDVVRLFNREVLADGQVKIDHLL